MQTTQLDAFTKAYIEAALFSTNDESTPEGGSPLDENFSADDFDAETLAKIVADCATFQASTEWQAALEANACGRAILNSQEEMGGHDFWLTRCRHGAGFWDGDWSEPHATALTGLAGKFGEVDILVGDDDKLYI
jgi:hypothetical protein